MHGNLRFLRVGSAPVHGCDAAEQNAKKYNQALERVPLRKTKNVSCEASVYLHEVRIPPGTEDTCRDATPDQDVLCWQPRNGLLQSIDGSLVGARVVGIVHAVALMLQRFRDVNGVPYELRHQAKPPEPFPQHVDPIQAA